MTTLPALPEPIELTPTQLNVCNSIAFRRWYVSQSSANNHGLAVKSIDLDYWACCAECAAAAVLGVFWPMGINTYKAEDLAGGYQVRSTDITDGCLIIRPDDDPNALYVLVVILGSNLFRVFPAIWGYGARKDEYWRTPNGRPGCWMVPQAAIMAQAAIAEAVG